MIPSEPSASKPRNLRIATIPHTPEWAQDTVTLHPSFSGAKPWKVQLELLPEQIALVYQQGLARGALVRLQTCEDWQPLLATRELQPVLAKAIGLDPNVPFSEIDFETPTRSLKVGLRPTPPPPPVELGQPLTVPRLRPDSVPDWNDISTGLFRVPAVASFAPSPIKPITVALTPVAQTTIAPTTIAPTSIESPMEPRTVHARPLELSAAVAATLLLTLLGSFGVRHWSQLPLQHGSGALAWSGAAAEQVKPVQSATTTSSPPPPASPPPPVSPLGVPVVSVRDLPTEAKRTASAVEDNLKPAASKAAPAIDEAALDKALTQAAEDAAACGASPMKAPVIVTFAPNGSVRFVRFATTVPQAPVRACALKAVARTRIPPFKGEAITVSKTLTW